jgi:hypothetical protein
MASGTDQGLEVLPTKHNPPTPHLKLRAKNHKILIEFEDS